METVRKVYQYAEPNLTLVGWLGLVGFPTYYIVWKFIFPQPYENAPLRILCAILLGGVAFRNFAPKYLKPHIPVYYLVSIGICLPFFFSYMMFKNGWTTVWAMSFMASIFLHILLVHQTRVMVLHAAIFISLAFLLVYGVDFELAASQVVWPYIPIFLFTYIFGNLAYFRNQVSHETKASIAKSFGAGIAHEMRNPLSALKSSLEVLDSILPKNKDMKRDFYSISDSELSLAREVLVDADEVIRSGNETIDLLLTSIDENRVSPATFKRHDVQAVVEKTLKSFSYKRALDRESVFLHVEQNFEFLGSDTLLKYALYNLLKNAFYYRNSNDFKIDVQIRSTNNQNVIKFRDNGIGIEPDILENIFKDFYTFGKNGSYGLGLPFCKKVMNAFGGNISCRSVIGQWTEFTLSFPKYESRVTDNIKLELMKSRSVLFVGETSVFGRFLSEQAFYQGFHLNVCEFDQALKREEYQFEFSLILLDLQAMVDKPTQFKALLNKLHFTEARIVFLYDRNQSYHTDIERHLTIYPVERTRLVMDAKAVLDELFFENPSSNRNLLPRKEAKLGKTIMIADDNHSLRAYTSILLEKQGYQIVQASDGQDVLDKLSMQSVDLIIMDLEMPLLDGIKTASLIRNSSNGYSTVPILAHTGDSRDETIDKIRLSGMNDYIVKPSDTELMLDKISDWI
ncbi:two-component system, CAI-1 autoinducer sensor kinase/phosphatase CqsS [Vibrio xiamenensis]|uniref:histidine kinase n=1 Tax=Vibrio xiamenensis TaxID=861298 RepID=A0A1G8GYI2_9VIBR|nr:hybrid sensor histidine kinase/response regulator [Vibrio xiamenensis]SDH99462.1 two-component system, CAI-1 autoinducer sensor kinase/phosphatase CqsS [Vibrio xiamenensis]